MNLHSAYFKIAFLSLIASLILYQPVSAQPIDLSLDDSIALTFKNNPALQIVEARKEQTVWAIKEAQSNKKNIT